MLPKIAKYFHRLIHHVEFSGIPTEFCKEWFFNIQRSISKTAKHFTPRASIWTIWATIFRDFATNFCFRIYYEQALFFLSSSSETRETEK